MNYHFHGHWLSTELVCSIVALPANNEPPYSSSFQVGEGDMDKKVKTLILKIFIFKTIL